MATQIEPRLGEDPLLVLDDPDSLQPVDTTPAVSTDANLEVPETQVESLDLADDDTFVSLVNADYAEVAALDTESDLVTLITVFLNLNPEPSDENIHALANSINLAPADLEEVLFSMMSSRLEDSVLETVDTDALEADLADEETDDYMGANVDQDNLILEPVVSVPNIEAGEDEPSPLDLSIGMDIDAVQVDSNNITTDPIDTDERMSSDGGIDPHHVREQQGNG